MRPTFIGLKPKRREAHSTFIGEEFYERETRSTFIGLKQKRRETHSTFIEEEF